VLLDVITLHSRVLVCGIRTVLFHSSLHISRRPTLHFVKVYYHPVLLYVTSKFTLQCIIMYLQCIYAASCCLSAKSPLQMKSVCTVCQLFKFIG